MKPRIVVCKTCGKLFEITNPRSRQIFCKKECRSPRTTLNINERVCNVCNQLFKPTYECQQYCSKVCKKRGFSINRKIEHKHVCLKCNVSFVNKKKNSKYCSHDCYAKRFGFVKKQCEICNNEFTTAYRFRGQKTCNMSCGSKLTSRKLNKREIKQCLQCDNDFEVVQSYKNKGKYCSLDCFYKHKYNRESTVVTLICEYCDNKFERSFIKRKARFCSKSCSNSGENNCMFGKPGTMTGKKAWNNGLTKLTDDRIRDLGKKISEILKSQFQTLGRTHIGINNPSFGRTRDSRTEEQLENYSKAAIQRIIDGKSCTHDHYIRGYYNSSKMNKELYYRSSYELRLMMCYDRDQSVISYEHEPFSIKYDVGKRYLPDFLIKYSDDSVKLVEAKPVEFVLFESVVKKTKAGIQYCLEHEMRYQIMTQEDIVKLENALGIHKNEWKSHVENRRKNIQIDIVNVC